MMIRFLRKLFCTGKAKHQDHGLQPEASVVVTFDSEIIRCQKPNSEEESIRWADLDAVLIETTDEGPIMPDVFWLLLSKTMKSGCVFPQGATGEEALLSEMQEKLPGFDNDMFIKAMTATENNKFLIWERKDQGECRFSDPQNGQVAVNELSDDDQKVSAHKTSATKWKKEIMPIEVWSDATNMSVVRMPGRNFPGLVVQGDKLIYLNSVATRVEELAKRTELEDLKREAANLHYYLQELLSDYSMVMKKCK
jgi:hypothetical protein